MSKNLIYIVAVNYELSPYTVEAWEWYSHKYDVDFKVIDTSSDKNLPSPHWERYTVIERFPQYKNYIYVDADALISPYAPDFFKALTNSTNTIAAVKEQSSLEWIYHSIQGYQKFFPDVRILWDDYYATGFLKFHHSLKIRNTFLDILEFAQKYKSELAKLHYTTLKKGFDQTPVNYLIKKSPISFYEISPMFSLSSLQKKDILWNGLFVNLGVIWQFNGIPQEARNSIIKQTWEQLKEKYE